MEPTPQATGAPIIRYRDVEIHRQEHVVLKHVNFELRAGEMVYLLGRVGSGKSSLLKTIYAEVPVQSGDAAVFDYDLRRLPRRRVPYLRREIGIVFQDFQLLHDRNVRDNLLFVLRATGWRRRPEIDERIDEVLARTGMSGKDYKMPHELSGGEQQRIVIARALLNHPRLILADEPTGNLDPETGEAIVEHLHAIASQGTAVVMATHNISLVERYPARTLRCQLKRLLEDDTFAPATEKSAAEAEKSHEKAAKPAEPAERAAVEAEKSPAEAEKSAETAAAEAPEHIPTLFAKPQPAPGG